MQGEGDGAGAAAIRHRSYQNDLFLAQLRHKPTCSGGGSKIACTASPFDRPQAVCYFRAHARFCRLLAHPFPILFLSTAAGFAMRFARSCLVVSAAAIFAAVASGCSSHVPDRVPAPDINPSAAASKAMELYDANHDGVLSGEELNKCPAIKSAIRLFTGPDGKVNAQSITAELQKIKDSQVGIMSLTVHVTLDDKRLSGATVLLDPEPFLAGSIAPAKGTTDVQGTASVMIDPQDRLKRGVNPGLYKVRISNPAGTIPPRYNKDTELGLTVSQDNLSLGRELDFALKSK
jgi:hypothetical protein